MSAPNHVKYSTFNLTRLLSYALSTYPLTKRRNRCLFKRKRDQCDRWNNRGKKTRFVAIMLRRSLYLPERVPLLSKASALCSSSLSLRQLSLRTPPLPPLPLSFAPSFRFPGSILLFPVLTFCHFSTRISTFTNTSTSTVTFTDPHHARLSATRPL